MVLIFKNKLKKRMIEISKELITGKIEIIEFLSILKEENDLLKWFNKYSSKKLYSSFSDFDRIYNNLGIFNIRIFVFQLIYGFLYRENIDVSIGAKDLLLYNSLNDQCPEWFQSDYCLLKEMFPNLNEIIQTKSLKSKLIEICKADNEYPVWLQNPEWVVVDGRPYKFCSQSAFPDDMDYDCSEIEYIFKNEENNEIKIIKQYD